MKKTTNRELRRKFFQITNKEELSKPKENKRIKFRAIYKVSDALK